jgi:hypothetical protein
MKEARHRALTKRLKMYTEFYRETLKGGVRVVGSIILETISKKEDMAMWIEFFWLRENGDEPLGSVKGM